LVGQNRRLQAPGGGHWTIYEHLVHLVETLWLMKDEFLSPP
jgi:hypothetical protein